VRGRKRKSKGDFLKIKKKKKKKKNDVENGDEPHGEEFGGGFA
jgi:hypothetical protein